MLKAAAFLLAIAGFLTAQQSPRRGVWAGISVPEPVYLEGETSRLQVFFAVINDTSATINPRIGESHLLINGVEPADWNFVIHNGLVPFGYDSLPPGRASQFGYLLGDRYFAKPGIYTLSWSGDGYKTADLTFRVIPRASR